MKASISGRSVDRITQKSVRWNLSLKSLEGGGESFRGRPLLTKRIQGAFEDLYRDGAKSTAYRSRANLNYFWRFLDDQELQAKSLSGNPDLSFDDLDWEELERIWPQFIDWLRHKRTTQHSKYYINQVVYAVFRRAFDEARATKQITKQTLEIYIFFQSDKQAAYGGDVLSFEEAKTAFRALARGWRKICRRVALAQSLAARGVDPATGSSGKNRWQGGGWRNIENRLWLVEQVLPFAGLSHKPAEFHKHRDGMRVSLPPELIIPELGELGTGAQAHVGARFLRLPELSIAFAMVTMKTGMNPDTVSRMLVSNWWRPDPLAPTKRAVLYGPKRIGNKTQRASSSLVRKTDAYQIIQHVIDVQKPIRDRLMELSIERNDPELKRRASMVWLGVKKDGLVDFLPASSTFYEAHQMLDAFFDYSGVVREDGSPMRYRMPQGRDIWGLFMYHRSSFNHLLTAQSLGHATIHSLLHYLEKRAIIVQDRKRLLDLQDQVFRDLKDGKYGPRRYREGAAELAATGLHCGDSLHPAADADPGHAEGQACQSQRCFTCWNWYASVESLPTLLRIIADLEQIRETLSVALWETSDYPVMLAVYKHIVDQFDQKHVEPARVVAETMRPIITTSMFVGNTSTREH